MVPRHTSFALATSLALAGLGLAACGGQAFIDAAPCDAQTCDGYCDPAGACVTRADVCERACEVIPVCMTPPKQGCYEECFADVADCPDDELEATDLCTDTLSPTCDAAGWLACVEAVACLGDAAP